MKYRKKPVVVDAIQWYVELVGNAISDGTLVVSKCVKPRAAF